MPKLVVGVVAVLAVMAVSMLAFVVFRPITVLPRLGLAPGFTLVDQTGARLTSEDLRGSIVVYTFGYSGCRGRCFPTDSILAVLQARLPEVESGGIPVRLVTISFDPARDTPEVLDSVARERGADPAVWRFATGEPAALKTLLGAGFGVYYESSDDGGFRYDPAFRVVDGAGLLRRRYQVGLPTVDALLQDLSLIAREARASTGRARLAYEAAHLFSCYSD